jgi:hypothetical protein
MSDLAAMNAASGDGQPGEVDTAAVIRRAEELLAEGDSRSARTIARKALSTLGARTDLLWVLADAEFAEGDVISGRCALDEAVAASPGDAASVARHIHLLRANGFWREALSVVEALEPDAGKDPRVRTEAGNFFHKCGSPAHAVRSFGVPRSLQGRDRAARRWCWLRSGGPSQSLRRKALRREGKALRSLRWPFSYIGSISDVEGLDPRHAQRVQGQLETYNYRGLLLDSRLLAVRRAGYRLIPLAVVPVWLALLAVVSGGDLQPGPLGNLGFAAVSAVIAVIPVIALVRAVLNPGGEIRRRASTGQATTGLLAFLAVETGLAEGYDHHLVPTAGWTGALVLGLAAGPAAVACLTAGEAVSEIYWIHLIRRFIREDVAVAALDSLLIVRYDLQSADRYGTISKRLYFCRHLEFVARWLARDLIPSSSAGFLGTRVWIAGRTAGWAEAVRHMERQVIAPVPNGQGKLQALLAHEIRCLASGDLGALAWREPPPAPSRRTTIRRQAIATARMIVVAVIPLAAVLAAEPFLHVSPGLLGWARITTSAWALLYVLLSIDPTIRDKIGAARDLADLVRPTPPGQRELTH